MTGAPRRGYEDGRDDDDGDGDGDNEGGGAMVMLEMGRKSM